MNNALTDAQSKFVALERRKDEHKQFFDDLKAALCAVIDEIGLDAYFVDDEGIVYKTVAPTGRWIDYEKISYLRTRRVGEAKGSLSQREAREAFEK